MPSVFLKRLDWHRSVHYEKSQDAMAAATAKRIDRSVFVLDKSLTLAMNNAIQCRRLQTAHSSDAVDFCHGAFAARASAVSIGQPKKRGFSGSVVFRLLQLYLWDRSVHLRSAMRLLPRHPSETLRRLTSRPLILCLPASPRRQVCTRPCMDPLSWTILGKLHVCVFYRKDVGEFAASSIPGQFADACFPLIPFICRRSHDADSRLRAGGGQKESARIARQSCRLRQRDQHSCRRSRRLFRPTERSCKCRTVLRRSRRLSRGPAPSETRADPGGALGACTTLRAGRQTFHDAGQTRAAVIVAAIGVRVRAAQPRHPDCCDQTSRGCGRVAAAQLDA